MRAEPGERKDFQPINTHMAWSINGVGLTCLHTSKSSSTLTMKALDLLIILPKCSLIESRQGWEVKDKETG